MSNPYPWIKDSKYGTTPSVTNYLEVTSSKGLYLNYANSTVLLKNPATSESLTMSKSAIDFYSTNGTSCVLIDNTHIHLNELIPSTTPFTTDITNQNIILQSNNNITPYLQTLTIQPNMLQHLNPDFSMIMGTGSYQTQALGVARTSTLNPYVCSVGFDGASYQGDVNCLNVNCGNNLQVVTINGLAPTTIGLVWADFNNAYPNLLNGRYYLTDTTYESYQDTQQFYARNMSVNQYASYDWNGIDANGGAFTLQTNSFNFDLYCATFNINGIPYSSSSSQDLNTTLGYGNNAGFQNIDNVNNINLSTINNAPYPPYPTSPYGLPSVLSIDATASTSINMNSQDINSVNNINVSTINGSSYPPSLLVPQTAYAMPFQGGYTTNFNQTIFTSGVTITGGYSYSVVWTFWYDSLSNSGSTPEMIQGYADLYNRSIGNIKGSANQSGYWASTTISSNNMYRTTITYTDNYFISFTDTYYPNVLQLNTINWDGTTYVSATISRTS